MQEYFIMTTKQIELVQASWQLVAAMDAQTAGSLFYNHLFEVAMEVKTMFSRSSMEEKSRKLLSMLCYVINKLHKLDDIIVVVRSLPGATCTMVCRMSIIPGLAGLCCGH